MSPKILLGPSPPPLATATAGYHKLPGIRARRLQRCNANHHLLPVSSCEPDTLTAEKAPGDSDRTIKQVQQLAHIPRPPPLITQAKGQIDPWWAIIKYYFSFPAKPSNPWGWEQYIFLWLIFLPSVTLSKRKQMLSITAWLCLPVQRRCLPYRLLRPSDSWTDRPSLVLTQPELLCSNTTLATFSSPAEGAHSQNEITMGRGMPDLIR